jgi:uncharacterized protein (TIGR01777 family)
VPLRRGTAPPDGPHWDPAAGTIDRAALEGLDAVVHLAGATIAGRFTERHRREVRESRIAGTRLLARTLASLARKPRVLVSASAVGIYGDRGDELLDESRPPGDGFLADVARQWEAETAPVADAGIRVVLVRTGLVLAREGGALPPLLGPARLGLGGPLGSGRQWWSWVALDDVLAAYEFAIANPSLAGPVNLAAPVAVRQAELARVLGRVLGRPAFVPAPALALRLLLGSGMADSLLLASARAVPEKLAAAGFRFRFETLEPALRDVLGPGHDAVRGAA